MVFRSPTFARSCAAGCAVLAIVATTGCDSLYYRAMKKVGFEKRDLLVREVRQAREAQVKAQEDFKTALERFRDIVEIDGGKLEETYERLNRELERSEGRARDVRNHVNDVRDVSKALFKEWQDELGKYSDRQLRSESERELHETRRRTEQLVASMDKVARRTEPVLAPLRDRVLFLKHNLNARALGALTRELTTVSRDVDALVADMQQAIGEADAYLKAMEQPSPAS
jgi:hypothetical protein